MVLWYVYGWTQRVAKEMFFVSFGTRNSARTPPDAKTKWGWWMRKRKRPLKFRVGMIKAEVEEVQWVKE